VRALLLRPIRFAAIPATIIEIVVLLVLYFGLGFASDFQSLADGRGELRVSWWLFQLPLALFATMLWFGWLLERASLQVVTSDQGVQELLTEEELNNQRPALDTSAVFATALAAAIMIDLVGQALEWFLEVPSWFDHLPSAWWFASLACLAWNAMRAHGVWRATRWLTLVTSLTPVLMVLAIALRYPMGPMIQRVTPQLAVGDRLASEEIWALQSKLLNDKLGGLLPQRPNVPELYFVSFAPDASENVFLRESAVIQALMDSRFDTLGRSIRLVNHASQYRSNPAASTAHLRQVLLHLGKLIDSTQDVVVLYLTAHGSRGFDLIANADAMELKNLRPEALDQMLKEAGIRHAVIAVSSCFSGGWIPALASAERLVMTASAANNTSFGCGSESEFTYWGKAVFDEGLRNTFSFETAFTQALPVLKRREAAAGHTWSDPQIQVGSLIRPALQKIQERLTVLSPLSGGVSVPVTESPYRAPIESK
jgi:Peptidase C13 family